LAAVLGQLDDRVDHRLEPSVGEHHGASMTSSDSSLASDSTISTPSAVPATTRSSLARFGQLVDGRVEDVLAVDVADARGADRAHERHARDRQRGRGATIATMSGSFSRSWAST
jgi:hypothetical protein